MDLLRDILSRIKKLEQWYAYLYNNSGGGSGGPGAIYTLSNINPTDNTFELLKDGVSVSTIDLSDYLDDTNLPRIVSGAVSGADLIFTRDDATTFTISDVIVTGAGSGDMVQSVYTDLIFGKNLFNPATLIDGKFINSATTINNNAGWGWSGYIPVVAGQTYTLSGNRGRAGWCFYANIGDVIAIGGMNNSSPTSDITRTVPAGANYAGFNLYTNVIGYSNVQLELGATATTFETYYGSKRLIKQSKLPFSPTVIDNTITESGVNPVSSKGIFPLKDRQDKTLISSKNLFDETKMQVGYIGSITNLNTIDTAWRRSAYIPVTAGQNYTLSGYRGRQGIAFYANIGDTNALLFDDNTSMPISRTAPVGANYIMFNVYQASNQTYRNLQLEKGSIATPYQKFDKIVLNENVIRDVIVNGTQNYVYLSDTTMTESFIYNKIGAKVLKIGLRAYLAGTKAFSIGPVSVDGVIILSDIDNTAPYRMDGSTVGGQHNDGEYSQNITHKYYVDGIEVTSQGTYAYKNNFTVVEKYSVTGPTTPGTLADVCYSFVFDTRGNQIIYTDIVGRLNGVPLQDIMFVMNTRLLGTFSMYIPKAITFSANAATWSFQDIQLIDSVHSSGVRVDITPARVDATGILADRAIGINATVKQHIGLIPVQSADPSVRRTNAVRKAMQFSEEPYFKIYMSTIDSDAITTLNNGDYYSAIAYKGFQFQKGSTTSFYTLETTQGIYVYIDWHVTIIEKVEMDLITVGKPYTVVEKSSSVTILSQQNTGFMVFDVTTKGYVILKF